MTIKTALLDRLLQWVLESKVSPIGWLNGYKHIIGNVLSIVSGLLVAIQQAFCPGWDMCSYVEQGIALIAFLLALLVKLVGEWHRKDKALRAVEAK